VVLRPLDVNPSTGDKVLPAWDAIIPTQQRNACPCLLIAQPDHAALAGDLAAEFESDQFPKITSDIVQSIALHDAGWAVFDGGSVRGGAREGERGNPLRDSSRRPLSFFHAHPHVFVDAWARSIERAEEATGPIGGLLVSGHFRRLAEHRVATLNDSSEDAQLLRTFAGQQEKKDDARFGRQKRRRDEIEALVDVLQFCDLLSLYLCCGARKNVQFPQQFGPYALVLRRDGDLCRLEPSPFSHEVVLNVVAVREVASNIEPNAQTLTFQLR
jgi:hypothetical protein